jgi:hypothetical protein
MKIPTKTASEAAKAVTVYLAKEEIYLDKGQAEQVAFAIDAELVELREATRYAMRRLETIREMHPGIALADDIERCRRALGGENAESIHPESKP